MGTTRLAYQPALDGLRAVAVAAVIVYHFEPAWMPGGFLGVDTFFVISGYLITALLLAEWRRDRGVGLRAFWARRARRLLPALFLVLAAVALAAARWLPVTELGRLRGDGLAGLFYVANWRQVLVGESYFELSTGPSPLRHLWSLAIEEQFYLVWPLVVLACLRLGRGRLTALAGVCVVGVTASSVAMAATFVAADPSRAYYGTDTRAHVLLVGAGLALVLTGRSVAPRFHRPLRVGGTLALAACAGAWWAAGDQDPWLYHGGFLAYAGATAVVIAATVATGPARLVDALSLPPARWVGQVSYGLYLWHWPVAVFLTPGRTGLDGTVLFTLRVAVTVGAAALSFYLVEQPIRTGSWPRAVVRPLAPGAAAAVIGLVVVATAGAQPLPEHLRTPSLARRELRVVEPARPPPSSAPAPVGAVPEGAGPRPAPPPPARVLLLGDSVAFTLEDAVTEGLGERGIAAAGATGPGCGVVVGQPLGRDGAPVPWGETCSRQIPVHQQNAVTEFRPDVVLWLSYWETNDRLVDGDTVELGTQEGRNRLLVLHQQAVDRLTATGSRVVVLLPPAPAPVASEPPDHAQVDRIGQLTEVLRRLAATNPDRVAVLDLDAVVCGGEEPCPADLDGVTPRPDDGLHFSDEGAALVAVHLADRLVVPAWPELWAG